MITRLDGDVGKVMRQLKDLGLDDRTIVFFTSDNGPHAEGGHDPKFFGGSGPLRGKKRDLTEGGIRVPMIARWPGKIEANTTSQHVAAFWDILPTAAELARATPPRNIDGLSMVNALFGHAQEQHDFYVLGVPRGQEDTGGTHRGLESYLPRGKPIQLFDLKSDLSEMHDVAGEHPEVVARIERVLRNARTPSARWPT